MSSVTWYTPEMNDGLTVFVFGSNLAGRHGKGAAKDAVRFWGAERYVANGARGQSYAIPTKDEHIQVLPITRIKGFVDEFIVYARQHPKKRFLVTEIGCGLAGYQPADMAPLFKKCPANCKLPDRFLRYI